jgi:lipid-binding SYLF domain-containing protein
LTKRVSGPEFRRVIIAQVEYQHFGVAPLRKRQRFLAPHTVSYGLQAGEQTFSQAMFLMTDSAINYLDNSDGWSVGMGPSVVALDAGKAKEMTTTTSQSDVYVFIHVQQGLMAGLGSQAQRIRKFNP